MRGPALRVLRWRPPTRPQALLLAVTVVVSLVAGVALFLAGTAGTRTDATRPGGAAVETPRSDLPSIRVDELPVEARDVLNLVDRGGPYPYRQDGTIFSNRERRLPERPNGYYREYTVPTPGSPDRGARRLVIGAAGDVYYTGDHYESFRQVMR